MSNDDDEPLIDWELTIALVCVIVACVIIMLLAN